MLLPRLSRSVLAAAAVTLAACQPGGEAQRAPAAAPQAEAPVDAGAPVLAAVQNARVAIAAGDTVGALNDVNLALGAAVRLPGAESALYPPEGAPPGYADRSAGAQPGSRNGGGQGGLGSGHHQHGGGPRAAAGAQAPAPPAASPEPAAAPPARSGGHADHGGGGGHGGHGGQGEHEALSAFDAQVKLISAQAKLQANDAAGADADLLAVEAGAHGPTPASLPLIRADQSLTLALAAVSGGRLGELRTQLAGAQAALEAYQGGPHAVEAKTLASAIGEALGSPGSLAALPPAEIALWAGVVGAWT